MKIMSRIDYRQQLEQAIAILYETFAIYSLRPHIEGCPCCVTEDDHKLIHSKRLNFLTSNELNNFAFSSMNTWGTALDFKHFLPRLLELIAFDSRRFWWSKIVIRSKLNEADYDEWQVEEKAAVERYLICLWNYILDNYPSHSIEPSEFIDSVAEIFKDLTPLLYIWQNHPSINSLLHLSEFIKNEINFNSPQLELQIIDLFPQQTGQLFAWLLRPSIIEKLERAFFSNLELVYADNLATVIDILSVAIAKPQHN